MQNFEKLATDTLIHLQQQFEDRIADLDECDLENGVLKVEMGDGQVYLFNRHLPLAQIWLSSPQSGAWHFVPEFLDDSKINWLSTRDRTMSLYDVLNRELSPITPFHL